jgi:peroxiredoxin Q/BCP
VAIGERVPSFRLPSGQGPELGPDDYRGRSNLIIWFTKGMACPFCRHQMSQLVRGYSQIQSLNAEILEVTPTPPQRAQLYVQKFRIPFPYLCDPDYQARRLYGVEVRPRSLGEKVQAFYQGMRAPKPPNDFGTTAGFLGELPNLVTDDDVGFFIVDKAGIVRYALAGPYVTPTGPRGIPSTEEILRELQRCEQGDGRRAP